LDPFSPGINALNPRKALKVEKNKSCIKKTFHLGGAKFVMQILNEVFRRELRLVRLNYAQRIESSSDLGKNIINRELSLQLR